MRRGNYAHGCLAHHIFLRARPVRRQREQLQLLERRHGELGAGVLRDLGTDQWSGPGIEFGDPVPDFGADTPGWRYPEGVSRAAPHERRRYDIPGLYHFPRLVRSGLYAGGGAGYRHC